MDQSAPGEPDALPSVNGLAVLGLLSVAPMTAYALAEQTSRALGSVWSASRRLLLGEPRRLAGRGLVESTPAPEGSRAGQQWRATEAGRQALRRWLESPVGPTDVNSELALRLIFADHADVATLVRQVEVRREQLRAEMEAGMAILEGYLEDGGPFPGRLHITAATSRLIAELKLAESAFLSWLLEELATWPDTRTPSPERHLADLEEIRERVRPVLDAW
ncbi:MAG: PadR family transcriptional regulator [Nocardioides sp.]